MDLLVSTYLYNTLKKKEPFEETDTSTPAPAAAADTSAGATVSKIISIVLSIFVSVASVYLSWSCNTAAGVDTGLKVVFAFFAFLFGWAYLIFYLIFRAGRCTPPAPQVVYMQAPPAAPGAPVVPIAPAPAPVAPAPAPAQVGGGRRGRARGGRKCR